MSTLYLTCGLPGSGKTSLARILEREAPALRLTGDDWMHRLYPGISTADAETGPWRGGGGGPRGAGGPGGGGVFSRRRTQMRKPSPSLGAPGAGP